MPALRLSIYYAAYFGGVGILLPFWPVWLSEHTVLAGEVKDNTVYRHEMSVLQIQQRIWDVEDRMKKVGRDSDLMNRLRELERSLKTAEGRLKKARGH